MWSLARSLVGLCAVDVVVARDARKGHDKSKNKHIERKLLVPSNFIKATRDITPNWHMSQSREVHACGANNNR